MITRFVLKHHDGNVKGMVIECSPSDWLLIKKGLRMVVKDPLSSKMDVMVATSMFRAEYEFEEVEAETYQVLGEKNDLREKALLLLLDWAIESGFGYDQFEDEYERYKDDVEDMDYEDGMIYIAEQVIKEQGE